KLLWRWGELDNTGECVSAWRGDRASRAARSMATSRESRPSSRLGRLERSAAAPTANVQHRTNPKRNAPMMARMAIVSISGSRGGVPGFPCDLDVEAVTAVPAEEIDRVALSCSCAVEAVAHLFRLVSRHAGDRENRDEQATQ